MRDVDRLVRDAVKSGWSCSHTGSGHRKLTSPDGQHVVYCSLTPSDHRAYVKLRHMLRKAGLTAAK